jgi:putative ABC transport system substrate-binding protein
MNRRDFVAGTAALLVSPRRSWAQGKPRRVGFLGLGNLTGVWAEPTLQKVWLEGLRNHGWIDSEVNNADEGNERALQLEQ